MSAFGGKADMPRSASRPTARHQSKKAHIIAMLRVPGGVTIEAMARAANWQPHSVRGFLAGVVRKKLGLNLISAAGDSGRVYRIADRSASLDTVPPLSARKSQSFLDNLIAG